MWCLLVSRVIVFVEFESSMIGLTILCVLYVIAGVIFFSTLTLYFVINFPFLCLQILSIARSSDNYGVLLGNSDSRNSSATSR